MTFNELITTTEPAELTEQNPYQMEEIEDEWLAEQAGETLENIRAGKEKTISWSEMKKRIA